MPGHERFPPLGITELDMVAEESDGCPVTRDKFIYCKLGTHRRFLSPDAVIHIQLLFDLHFSVYSLLSTIPRDDILNAASVHDRSGLNSNHKVPYPCVLLLGCCGCPYGPHTYTLKNDRELRFGAKDMGK